MLAGTALHGFLLRFASRIPEPMSLASGGNDLGVVEEADEDGRVAGRVADELARVLDGTLLRLGQRGPTQSACFLAS